MLRFVVAALMMAAVAQDPTKSLPDSYKVQFENDYASVVRVRYGAGAKLPDHTHPAGTTVYVYLNDSDGVVFRHSGNNTRATTRPAVKAGAIRVSAGSQEEHHTAENTSATASDFLRIVLRTENPSGRAMRRIPPGETEYSTRQLRVTRMKVDPHQTLTVSAKEPALVIELPSGTERWLEAGATTPVTNHDARALDLVRLDFLTAPVRRERIRMAAPEADPS